MRKQQKNILLSVCSALAALTMISGAGMISQPAKAAETTPTFEMIYGAGIRASEPTGIRFKTKMSAEYYNQLNAGTDNAQLHFVLVPYAMYKAYQADSAKGNTALYPWLASKYSENGIVDVAIPAEKLYTVTENGETYYCANGVLSNVYFNNYHLNFVGVAYIQRGTAGNYSYQDVTDITDEENARSVFEVACKASENDKDYAKYKTFLDTTVEKGMYRAYGVSCQQTIDAEGNKTTESYTYGGETYASYEEMKSGLGISIADSTVTIDGETISVAGGCQQQLEAALTFSDGTAYTKNAYYTWSSSDESVVSIDENGVVTARKLGEATITVSAVGGRFTDTCTVNVVKGGTVNLDYQFLVQGDAGAMATNTGNATVDLTDSGIVGTDVSKVLCGGAEVTVASKTENSITLTNAPAGMQEYTFETTVANYVLEGCVYGQGISTKDEFLAWQTAAAAGTGKCYTVLLDDIDLDGATLTEPTTYYYGTFDGMNHTVSDFTYTKGVIWMMYPSVVKNVQFTEAVQDCAFKGTSVVDYGFFGQVVRGTVKNVKVSTSTINVGAVHRSVIAFAFNNGNTEGAPAILQNVIFEVTPEIGFAHYAYQAQSKVEGLASIDSVYMYFTNGATGGFDIFNDGVYTNSRFFASKGAMLSSVDFSTWEEPWQIGADGVPYLGKKVERETVEIAGEFLAKGDAPISETNANTGNVIIDLSSTGYDFSGTTQVLCNGEAVTLAGKTATSVTVTNAPQGDGVYTIMTPTATYIVNVCVYVYGISNVNDFKTWQAGPMWKYAILLNDIDMDGAVLADNATGIRGWLDGREHVISNFTVQGSLVETFYAAGGVKNLALKDFTQDCTTVIDATNKRIISGIFGTSLYGAIENVLIEGKVTNISEGVNHNGILCYNTQATATIKNVVLRIVGDGTANHLITNAANGTIDYLYMTYSGSGTGVAAPNASGATHKGVFASEAAMLAEVDFSTWEKPWKVDKKGSPYIGKTIEDITVAVSGVLDAPAGGRTDSDKTGMATVDFAATGYVLRNVYSVKCGTAPIEFVVNDNVLTLIDAPKGEKVYTISADGVKYIVTLNVYEVEKTAVTVKGTFFGTDNDTATLAIESATVDFTDTVVTLGEVQAVAYGDGTMATFTADGNTLTLINAPAGEQTYTVTTDLHIYTLNICLYGKGISNAEEFLAWHQVAATKGSDKAYTVLLDDIDLAGAEITQTTTYYYGTFDGRAHTVSDFTYSTGFLWPRDTGVVKNVQFTEAVQDCSFQGDAVVQKGLFGSGLYGTVENIKLSVTTKNISGELNHRGVLSFTVGNGSNLKGYAKNVIIELNPQEGNAHYVTQVINAGSTLENVHMYIKTSGSGIFCATNNGTATNSNFHDSAATMLSRVDFSTWEEPWLMGDDGIPYIGESVVVEKQAIEVAQEFLAKGDAGTAKANTGNATVDFTDTVVTLGEVQSVTYGAENTEVSYTANGNALTFVDAPAGTEKYTIVTNEDTYIVDICVYGHGISTAEEFIAWRNATGDGTSTFWAYTVLLNDIDLKGAELTAVSGYMRGWLDGRGHTIANFTLPSTVTGLLPRIYSKGGVKNLQIINVMQNCSSATADVNTSIVAQMIDGAVENLLIKGEVSKLASGYQHRGIVTYGATASAKIKNVIVEFKSTGDKSHYAVGINSAVGATIDGVYTISEKTAFVCQDTLNATNTGVYATASALMSAVDFSAWGEPWIVDGSSLPYMRNYSKYLGFIHDAQVGTTSYSLIKDGASSYKVLMNSETYAEIWTPYIDFRTYLAEATGVTLSWANDGSADAYDDSKKFISFGNTAALSQSGIVVDYDLLGTQGYQIITLGDDIYVCGSNQGISNAVYDLLHRLVGLEVYTTTRYVINQVSEVALPNLSITEVPDIEYRVPLSGEMSQYKTQTNATRRALRLQNNADTIVDGGRVHNMTTTVVPYDEWGSTKTNWFGPVAVIDNKKVAQLCYTAHGNAADYNAMVAEAVENVKAALLADVDSNVFSLTQMDLQEWCTCSACKALKEQYGTDAVSQIIFVNDVTDILNEWLATEQGGREVQFAIFAYYATADAPATKNADGSWTAKSDDLVLNENVSVWIAAIDDDFRVSINAENSANEMRTMIESWGACASSYFIWAYDGYFNNYMIPYDTYGAIQEMVRFCAEYDTKLFYPQGSHNLTQNTAFTDVKEYLYAKLMWNCNLDVNTLIDNFFKDVYKEAGNTMQTVFENWREKSKNLSGSIYGAPDNKSEIKNQIGQEWLKAQMQLLETAVSQIAGYKTSDPELYTAIYDSIIAESISLRYLYYMTTTNWLGNSGTEYASEAWSGTLTEDAARLGVNRSSENTEFSL